MGNTINYSPKEMQVEMSADVAHLFMSVLVFIYFHFSSTGLHSILKVSGKDVQKNLGFSALCDGQECEHLHCGAFI